MKAILLTNVGNRNIDNKYSPCPDPRELKFRQWSKELLESIDTDPSLLNDTELKILPDAIQKIEENKIDKNELAIYLFASNCLDNRENFKDTIFSAQIVKRKLVKIGHPEELVHIEELQCRSVDYDSLVARFILKIKKILNDTQPSSVFALISSGTPQMKTSMDEVIQFLSPNFERITVEQGSDLKDATSAILESPIRAEVQKKTIAVRLLHSGISRPDVAAALLFESEADYQNKTIDSLNGNIEFVALNATKALHEGNIDRFENFFKIWEGNNLKKEKKEKYQKAWIKKIQSLKNELQLIGYPFPTLRETRIWSSFLLFGNAQYHLKCNRFEEAVLSFIQAMERLLDFEYDHPEFNGVLDRMRNNIEIKKQLELWGFNGALRSTGLATGFLIHIHEGKGPYTDWILTFCPGLVVPVLTGKQTGLLASEIRNKFVHEGRRLERTEKRYSEIKNSIEESIKSFFEMVDNQPVTCTELNAWSSWIIQQQTSFPL